MSDKSSRVVEYDDYVIEMDDEGGPADEEEFVDDESYMYEDEIIDPREKKKDGKTVILPAKEKRLGGKKAYKEYMESMKNQKRNLPINTENLPLKHKIKKIFKNDHRYYGKYVLQLLLKAKYFKLFLGNKEKAAKAVQFFV